MKRSFSHILLPLCLAGSLENQGLAAAYDLQLQPGFNLIANHLQHTPNNQISVVFGNSVPVRSEVTFWDVSAQQFSFGGLFDDGVWSPDPALTPGAGAIFRLPGNSPVTVTLSGTAA